MVVLSEETEALARLLADAKHVSIEDAILQASEERVRASRLRPEAHRSRDRSPEAIAARQRRIDEIVRKIAAMPVLDPRSPSEIVDDINEL